MPNSDLIGKNYKVPDKVIHKINQQLSRIDINDKHAKGVKRAKDIVNNKTISHGQMVRLKNYFDDYDGDKKDDEYNLIGGAITRKWIDGSLGHDRQTIKQDKQVKMRGGMENQFLKTHEKDTENTNPTNPDGGLVDISKSSKMRNIMANDAVYKTSTNEDFSKEITTIKYLIEYMSK